MQKLIIACLFLAVVFAGCSKPSHTESRNPGAGTEPSITEAQKDMDKEFEEKVSQIDQIGKEVIENIRTEASKAISDIQNAAKTDTTTTKTTTIATTTTTIPEPKTIELNVESESDGLKFTLAKANYEHGYIDFYYSIETDKRLLPGTATLEDSQGDKLTLSRYGATPHKVPKKDGEKYEYKDCVIGFQGLTPEHDLSHVTLTYAFEGYDPVTVEFDIPVL